MSSRNRAERGVKGCVLAGLLVAALLGVLEGLVAQPYLVNRHEFTIPAMKRSSCPSWRSPMGSLQHQHFWLMRRWCSCLLGSCVGATTHGLLSTLLFCIYLLWSGLRRDNTTGEVFICRPEEAKQSIEWNPKSYGLLRPGHFIRRHEAKHVHIHIYTKKKWNINMLTCICDFIRCWPDSQLPR